MALHKEHCILLDFIASVFVETKYGNIYKANLWAYSVSFIVCKKALPHGDLAESVKVFRIKCHICKSTLNMFLIVSQNECNHNKFI